MCMWDILTYFWFKNAYFPSHESSAQFATCILDVKVLDGATQIHFENLIKAFVRCIGAFWVWKLHGICHRLQSSALFATYLVDFEVLARTSKKHLENSTKSFRNERVGRSGRIRSAYQTKGEGDLHLSLFYTLRFELPVVQPRSYLVNSRASVCDVYVGQFCTSWNFKIAWGVDILSVVVQLWSLALGLLRFELLAAATPNKALRPPCSHFLAISSSFSLFTLNKRDFLPESNPSAHKVLLEDLQLGVTNGRFRCSKIFTIAMEMWKLLLLLSLLLLLPLIWVRLSPRSRRLKLAQEANAVSPLYCK